MKILLDTNVIIDVLASREPFCKEGFQIFKMVESSKIQGCVTANSITDVYYILGRSIPDPNIRKVMIRHIINIFTIIDVTQLDIEIALNIDIPDFEDALQIQCARKSKADYIITCDTKDFDKSPVKAISPLVFLERVK